MSAGYGEGNPVDSITGRGRDWPCLRQFIVFLENRVGALHDVLRRVERDDLRIVGLSILDSADCAIARIIVDNYERAHELLTFANITMFETDIVGSSCHKPTSLTRPFWAASCQRNSTSSMSTLSCTERTAGAQLRSTSVKSTKLCEYSRSDSINWSLKTT